MFADNNNQLIEIKITKKVVISNANYFEKELIFYGPSKIMSKKSIYLIIFNGTYFV